MSTNYKHSLKVVRDVAGHEWYIRGKDAHGPMYTLNPSKALLFEDEQLAKEFIERMGMTLERWEIVDKPKD
jgi:hypothetical protein